MFFAKKKKKKKSHDALAMVNGRSTIVTVLWVKTAIAAHVFARIQLSSALELGDLTLIRPYDDLGINYAV